VTSQRESEAPDQAALVGRLVIKSASHQSQECGLSIRRGSFSQPGAPVFSGLKIFLGDVPLKIHGSVKNSSDLRDLFLNAEENEVAAAGGDLAVRKKVVPETKGVWFFENF